MRTQLVFAFSILLFVFQPLVAWQKKKELKYKSTVYESNIKTVQLFPEGNSVQTRLSPAVVKINESKGLVLEFDDLRNDADYYFVRFVHCDADWTPSDLRPNMYLSGFNEFEIEDFEFSSESKTNYVHYKYRLPQFELTGNYLAIVYRDRKKNDIVLSERFIVYQNEVGVGGNINRSSAVSERLNNQRIEVTLNYGSLNSLNPREDFKVVIRQNQRPDTKITLLPTFIDENNQVIRYQNLGDENDFLGGNEFRFFDLSTINFSGRNVSEGGFEGNKPFALLNLDQPRSDGYFQNLDLNGQYYIRDLEGGGAFAITAEYINTTFRLKVEKQTPKIYVLGAFNRWKRDDLSEMKWNDENQWYETQYILKQGWYDYLYWDAAPNKPNSIEGSFFETENMYEVFVYFKPVGGRGDLLVGYNRIDYNRRR